MKTNTKLLVGILAVMLVALGFVVGDDTNLLRGELRPVGRFPQPTSPMPYPPSTSVILYRWLSCNNGFTSTQIFQPTPTQQDTDFFARCLNSQPQRICGAVVSGSGQDNDTDGDGISNRWEYVMGTNPCEKYSFGGAVADGDFDYDNDGTLNKNDSAGEPTFGPACTPTVWFADCI